MPISRGRRCHGGRLVALAVLVLALHAGCAGRSGRAALPDAPAVAKRPPADERHAAGAEQERIRLPGQNRWLPSEDPRNRPAGESPPAASAMRAARRIAAPASTDGSAAGADPIGERGVVETREPHYAVQVLASATTARAYALRAELEKALGIPVAVDSEDGIWKVRLGHEAERDAAEELRRRLVGLGYEDAFVVFRGRR